MIAETELRSRDARAAPAPDALAELIYPLDAATFLSRHLEKSHVVTGRPDPLRFRELLSLADLDTVLGTFGVKHPDIRLVKHETDVAASEYTYGDNVIDPMRAARHFADGATVVFAGLQDRIERVRELCTAIALRSSMRTQANIYLTPPHSQGFDVHWDTHDVFVLQIEGTKSWRIHDGGPAHPLGGQKFDPARHGHGDVIDEFTLHAGQVLYIPRGLMHAAAATETVSLHITLGMIAYTWIELLSDCLTELAERSPEWRESLPFGFARDADAGGARLDAALRDRIAALAHDIDVPGVAAARAEVVEGAHRPRQPDYLRQALRSRELRPEHVIELRSGPPVRVDVRDERVVVRSGQREVAFPAAARRTLEQVLAGEPVSLGAIDDGLDADSRATVVSTLIREGIVTNRSNPNLETSRNGR